MSEQPEVGDVKGNQPNETDTPSASPDKKDEQGNRQWWKSETFWAAAATIVIAIFTVVLARIGYLQYRVSKQVNATGQNARRAFVIPKEVRLSPVRTVDGSIDYWRLSAILENAGESAAAKTTISIQPLSGPAVNPEKIEIPVHGTDTWTGEIGPHQDISVFDAIVTRTGVEKIIKGQEIFVLGTADYRDVFGATHATKFCFHVYGGPRSGAMPEGAINLRIDKTDLAFDLCRHNNAAN
jgi:hypothetical protein